MHRLAYLLCGLCLVSLAAAAHADVLTTYTWETLSQSGPNLGVPTPIPNLTLSFTVDGPVSIGATNLDSPFYQSPPLFPLPPELVALNVHVGDLGISLSSFTYEGVPGFLPQWTLELSSDPANATADLAIFFYGVPGTDEISGPGGAGLGNAGTGVLGTIFYGSDDPGTGCFAGPCTFTGILVASPAPMPEPPSLWVLIAGLATLGFVKRPPMGGGGDNGNFDG